MGRKVSKPRSDREIMAPSSQIKRRKTDHTSSRRTLSSAAVERGASASTKGSTFPVASGIEFRIQQDKSFAVAQAKQDGCTEVRTIRGEKDQRVRCPSKETWPCLTEQPVCPKRKTTVPRTSIDSGI